MSDNAAAPPAPAAARARPPIRPAVRLLPGAVFLAYLLGTVVLFYAGPWRYEVTRGGELLVFLVAIHLALAGGYLSACFRAPLGIPLPVGRIALGCILLDLALLFPTSAHNTGSWLPPVWSALRDLGDAYLATLHLQTHQVPYVNYLRILVAPLLAAAVPLGIYYWRRLPRLGRVALVLLVVGTLALFVSMGTNKALGEWAMLFPWFLAAGHLSGVLRLRGRQWAVVVALVVLSFALFFVFFGATMNARGGSYARSGTMQDLQASSRLIDPPAAETLPPSEAAGPADEATPTAAPPEAARVAVNGLAAYLTQGYYAVDLSLQEPFVPMWGVGHSVFLTRQAVRVTGDASLFERPYPVRIEERGWHSTIYWASIYPWIASDVGFVGVVVVVFLVGRLLALVWIDVLGGENPLAVALFGQMVLMLYYFPAHNRVLQTGEGVVAFWGLLLLWWLPRRRLGERARRWWRRVAAAGRRRAPADG
jgi:hypothetical protein